MSIFDDVEGLSPEIKEKLQAKLSGTYVPKSEFDAVLSKKEELLGETKAAKEKARIALEEAEKERKDKLDKSGDAEALKKYYEEQIGKLNGELDSIKTQTKKQALNTLASGFVAEKFIDDALVRRAATKDFENRLDMRDGKPVVLDADGNLTGLSIQDLQNEFMANEVYARHIVGSRASGGGANGGGNGGGAAKVITRAAFDALNAESKMEFIKDKGTIKN